MTASKLSQCGHPGCDRTRGSALYCTTHWRRFNRGDDMDAPIRKYKSRPNCSVCGEPSHSRGLCNYHYNHRNRAPDNPVREYAREGCLVPDCTGKHADSGLCSKHAQRRRKYNLTVQDLLATYTSPCRICGAPPVTDSSKRPHGVDHDHSCCPGTARSCGKCVRGVLCHGCNSGLGAFRDDIDRMKRAIRYVESWNKDRVW